VGMDSSLSGPLSFLSSVLLISTLLLRDYSTQCPFSCQTKTTSQVQPKPSIHKFTHSLILTNLLDKKAAFSNCPLIKILICL